jgi:hypothetical protein
MQQRSRIKRCPDDHSGEGFIVEKFRADDNSAADNGLEIRADDNSGEDNGLRKVSADDDSGENNGLVEGLFRCGF